MSAARQAVGAVAAHAAVERAPAAPAAAVPLALARRLAARLRDEWLPRATWTVGRTGWPGLAGIALLLASAVFLLSTHLPVASEVDALRAEVAARRQAPAEATPGEPSRQLAAPRTLPARGDVPAVLRRLFAEAKRARLAVDTGRYEVKVAKSGSLVRFHVTFPVTGPYPRIRAFLDATLARMPTVALTDLSLERRAIGDADVEAQLRMTLYTRDAGTTGAQLRATGPSYAPAVAGAAGARLGPSDDEDDPSSDDDGVAPTASERVVAPTHAEALFERHSWYVAPPPRLPDPPPRPPPPPEPTAPPLPYAFVGRYAPGGDPPVYFLSRGDRVIQVRVGDRIDGVYQLESASPGQLVFLYLPLEVRQLLKAGGSK